MSTCISRHLKLRTGGFCWCKVLLPMCPCWQQPVHSDKGEDAGTLLNRVIYTVSVPTHTHPFNGPLSGTTWVSRYQKGKTDLDFTEARDSEWQWHQLGHMQVCTSLQTDNHTSTPPLSFYRPDALPAAQPTVSKHWRQKHWSTVSVPNSNK